MIRIRYILLLIIILVGCSTIGFVEALLQPNQLSNPATFPSIRIPTFLSAEDKPKKQGRAQGVYVRPSGAIEKGSGFFVPGLEGPKVRLVIGLVLLGATAVNHFLLDDVGSFGNKPKIAASDGFLSFSETAAVVYSILLLFQSAIEYAKEALPETYEVTSKGSSSSDSTLVADSNTEVLDQKWSETADESDSYRSRVQWAAASYLSMTPTTQMMLLNEKGVHYRLGSSGTPPSNDDTAGVAAALEELSKSKGGRIALPLTHPAVQALLNNNETENKLRTVILQRITDDSCWMVSSDQLLAGYTGGDLKWLGKLAGYVAESE